MTVTSVFEGLRKPSTELVFASLRSDQSSRMEMAAVALIVRTIDSNLYQKFIHGEATDDEVVDMVFSRPGAKILRQCARVSCSRLRSFPLTVEVGHQRNRTSHNCYDGILHSLGTNSLKCHDRNSLKR